MPLAISKGPPGRHAQALLAAVAVGEGTPAAREAFSAEVLARGYRGDVGGEWGEKPMKPGRRPQSG